MELVCWTTDPSPTEPDLKMCNAYSPLLEVGASESLYLIQTGFMSFCTVLMGS